MWKCENVKMKFSVVEQELDNLLFFFESSLTQ